MDLTVSSYRPQQPAFKGFWNPSATRACQEALGERLSTVMTDAVTKQVSGASAYVETIEKHNMAVDRLDAFVKALPENVGICSGEGSDAVFKFVVNDGAGNLTFLPTTGLFEKVSVKDAFDAIQLVSHKLTTEFKPIDVVNSLLTKMMTEPTVVNGRQITLRPRKAILESAEKFAKENGAMDTFEHLKANTADQESAFVSEYRALQELLH